MAQLLQFTIFGIGIGAVYALTTQGLVLIYRGSGVLNFAQAGIGLLGGYVWWELQYNSGLPFGIAFPLAVAFAAGIGAAVHWLLMRPLRHASPLMRIVASLGVLIVVQSLGAIRYANLSVVANSELPTSVIKLGSGVYIPVGRLILLGLAIALTGVLWYVYKRTRFGLATTAAAENQRVASSLGWSPDFIATVNWMVGSALAAVAAILLAPLVSLQPATATAVLMASLAAAVIAGFQSFPIALVASIGLGVATTVIQRYVQTPNMSSSVPFFVLVIVILVRGRSLPLRDFFLQRLPAIGSGRLRPAGILIAVGVVTLFLALVTNQNWILAMTTTLSTAIVLLSIVVLTGYAGQLSLAQYAFAGFGAWIAGRMIADTGASFLVGLTVGVLAAVPLGILFALPAVRARGINLAVITLGLGSALELMVFDNQNLTGGFGGTTVPSPTILGWSIDPFAHATRFAFVNLAGFVIAAVVVANVRRGRSGRRLVAVRTNERAAAALGISVRGAKLYAFGLASGVAALGGILIAFQTTSLVYTQFMSNTSVTYVAWTTIGGVGYIFGAIQGAFFAPGTIGGQIANSIFGTGASVGNWVAMVGSLLTLIIIVKNQNGLAEDAIVSVRKMEKRLVGLFRKLQRRRGDGRASTDRAAREVENVRLKLGEGVVSTRVAQQVLAIDGVTVSYGATVAVRDATVEVHPGEVVGLIGPNGAGKTSLIDAATGFTRCSGQIRLGDNDLGGVSPAARARLGMSRSFQSLELFEDSSVLDNIRAACDPADLLSYFRDLVWPKQPPLPPGALAAIDEFDLGSELMTRVEDLPYGKRRLLAMARAVASQPSALLLDEPAAGLNDAETRELGHVVRRLADEWGIGILLVEHDMNFVMSVCDRIVVLDFGQTIASGSPGDIRANPAVIAAYLGDETETATTADASTPGQPSYGPNEANVGITTKQEAPGL